ncbi:MULTISPECIES: TetR/AcrR family transcriptional regulator [Mycobacteriaceae]|uniref:TetR/AcrR family transcriptional regulator n=1 Tax=Mycobacteriaceae TaxID=1762 RepID=UPI0009A89DDE|nr:MULTISPECIES: TetR/AcrR family transcriptional regulator [Mycobacteriaceae]SKQ79612.1 Putative transcriptional regulator, TetR family [Mycobacteroides abscessus subsp. massiliense]
MPADGLSRTARRAAATCRAIVDAAEGVVLECGADALTLEAVADRADVAVQTIYNRIGGRSAVLIAVAERALEQNRQYMDAAYAAAGSPVERIMRAAEAYTRFALERPDQFRLLINPPRERNAFDRVARLVEEQNTKLAEALAEGIADGSINSHLDPAVAATALWAAMNGILALNWRPDRQPRDDRTADELIATWIAITTEGLFARGA